MSNYVFDAYAWIEYLNGTKLGEKVKDIIENKNNSIFTNILTIAEISSSYTRNKLSFEEELKYIYSLSKVFNIDVNFVEEVGKLHGVIKKERKHISLADIFVLLTARKLNAKVVTGDEDFRGLKEVIMIK